MHRGALSKKTTMTGTGPGSPNELSPITTIDTARLRPVQSAVGRAGSPWQNPFVVVRRARHYLSMAGGGAHRQSASGYARGSAPPTLRRRHARSPSRCRRSPWWWIEGAWCAPASTGSAGAARPDGARRVSYRGRPPGRRAGARSARAPGRLCMWMFDGESRAETFPLHRRHCVMRALCPQVVARKEGPTRDFHP
jgi:hypothetical protein